MFNAMCVMDTDTGSRMRSYLAAYNAELSFALARLLTRSLTCLHCFTHTPQKTKKRRHAKSWRLSSNSWEKGCVLGQASDPSIHRKYIIAVSAQKAKRQQTSDEYDNNNGGGSQTRRNGRVPMKKNANSDLAEREERNHESTQKPLSKVVLLHWSGGYSARCDEKKGEWKYDVNFTMKWAVASVPC
jgi:hypothetical protein